MEDKVFIIAFPHKSDFNKIIQLRIHYALSTKYSKNCLTKNSKGLSSTNIYYTI